MDSGDPDTVADLSDTVADSDSDDHIDWDIVAVSGAQAALVAIAVDAQSLAACASNLAGAANLGPYASLGPDGGLCAANLGPGVANLDPDNPDAGGSATTGLDVDFSDLAMARMYANLANPFWAVVDAVSTIGLDDRSVDLVMDDKLDSIDRSDQAPDSDSVAFGLLQDNMAPDPLCAEVAPAADWGRPGEECLVAVTAPDF